MKQHLIVFDIDGTLIDSASLHGDYLEISLRNQGVTHIDTNWDAYEHHTDSFIIRENLHRNGMESGVESCMERVDQNLLDLYVERKSGIFPFPGLHKLFQKLRENSEFDYCFATGSLRKSAEFNS